MAIVKIQYFAALREQAGLSREDRETNAADAGALYAELCAQYGFTLAADQVKVAVNAAYSTMDHALQAGDEVVFIPPVSGG